MVRRKVEKTAALILAALIMALSLVSVFCSGPDWSAVGVFRGASMLSRLGYSFFHASVLHAALNAWCLLSIVFLYDVSWRRLLVAYLVAVCVPDFALSSLCPTVGLSVVCFALLGLVASEARNKLFYNFCIIFYLFFGFLLHFINGWIHLYGYIAGLLVGVLVMPVRLKSR